jgi:hypothetical protein
MKILQTIKLVLIIYFSLTALLSNAIDLDSQKEVLKRIWICQIIMKNHNYILPAEYTVDTASNNLTGQLFYAFDEMKYNQLFIDFSKSNSIKSTFKNGTDSKPHAIQLQFENGELVSVKEGRNDVYKIRKEENGNYVVNKEYIVNEQLKSDRNNVEMDGDKIVKIDKYMFNKNKEFHSLTATYTHSDGQLICNRVNHTDVKGNTKHNIKPFKSLYKIKSENNVYTENNFYGSIEYTYNQDGYAIEKISQDKGTIKQAYFEYIDGNLSKTVTMITKNNVKQKEIRIPKDLPDADTGKPEHEWRQGIYLFDENDTLVYESRHLKYRTKVNGVWGEWEFMNY